MRLRVVRVDQPQVAPAAVAAARVAVRVDRAAAVVSARRLGVGVAGVAGALPPLAVCAGVRLWRLEWRSLALLLPSLARAQREQPRMLRQRHTRVAAHERVAAREERVDDLARERARGDAGGAVGAASGKASAHH